MISALEAAIKLCDNLVGKLEQDDAREFAAYVAGRVAMLTGQAPEHLNRQVMDMYRRLLLERMENPGGTGNCADCGAPSWVEPAGIVVHAGYACTGFRVKFPQGGATLAKDQLGWGNRGSGQISTQGTKPASEKQVLPASEKQVVPVQDDAKTRYALLELDLDKGPKKKAPEVKPERIQLEMK